jgi:hypothetical protein
MKIPFIGRVLPRFFAFIWANIGHCPRCMARSFQAMTGLVAIAFVMQWATEGPFLLFIEASALAAGVLWLSHFVAFAVKSAHARRQTGTPETSLSRRQSLMIFARAAVYAAAATAWPFTKPASANCGCTEPTPKCCWNFKGDTYICAPEDAYCCGHETHPWYCTRPRPWCHGERGCRS